MRPVVRPVHSFVMDVSIKLSFTGGHVWDFVCDEDDPLVMGVVSALPGAMVDQNLPPDGLIQVEARSGERLFFSRASLVSVAIRRLPKSEDDRSSATSPPTSPEDVGAVFLVPQALGRPTIEALLTQPEFPMGGGVPQDVLVDLPSLPDAIVDTLVALAAKGASALAVRPDQPTQLDVQTLSTSGGPLRSRPGSLLDMRLVLAAPRGVSVTRTAPIDGEGENADSSRHFLHLEEGDLLVTSPAAGDLAVRPNGEGTITLLAASLHVRSDPGGA